jgi:hypothetical protein
VDLDWLRGRDGPHLRLITVLRRAASQRLVREALAKHVVMVALSALPGCYHESRVETAPFRPAKFIQDTSQRGAVLRRMGLVTLL